jgi:thioredoxin-like negative regulator of GroEL
MTYHSYEINDERLHELIERRSGDALVSFFAWSSIPCDHFRPEFEALADELAVLPMRFYRIDAGENPSICQAVGIEAVPTVVFYSKGDEIKRWEGPYSREALGNRVREEIRRRR